MKQFKARKSPEVRTRNRAMRHRIHNMTEEELDQYIDDMDNRQLKQFIKTLAKIVVFGLIRKRK